jgi:hypothetical protein
MKYSLTLSAFLLYVTIQAVIRFAYHDTPAASATFFLAQNLRAHAERPMETMVTLFILFIIPYFAFRNWKAKPYLLRVAFIILHPAFVILYLLCGQAFEFRVFGELYPVAALLTWKGVS